MRITPEYGVVSDCESISDESFQLAVCKKKWKRIFLSLFEGELGFIFLYFHFIHVCLCFYNLSFWALNQKIIKIQSYNTNNISLDVRHKSKNEFGDVNVWYEKQ